MRAKDLELYEQDQLNDLINKKPKKTNKMVKLKTINIKGKNYVTVNERIKYFREHFTGYSLTSEITHINESGVIIKAELRDPEGNVLATGIGHEKQGSSFINKTSFIENCETSAWGRCLGNFGIGIDESVASADEVANAIKNQS
jgi:hypothetical protein|tara:strand:- start:407 stop:838 length:432 start_codon:yes stop_codon:yes gene_type:complete